MVMEDYNSDAIISDPLTSRADTELIHAQSKNYMSTSRIGAYNHAPICSTMNATP